ncbi:zinc finger protein OZF-like [Coregonus clupeaformis]|uniref:zinc finger protein OZF-like n=1 Tax=Coregonus clupeaformis TaxID=59861 RepID=UPI001E1C5B5D|nr:zinc finger protein OZF-like [Coregonus clupeaformis]
MSKIEYLRVFLNQKLIAAAEEIFGVVEETIAEYQEEVSRTKEENRHLRSMLDVRTKPDIKLHSQADLQQLTVTVSDEVISLEQQEWSPSLGQKDPEPTQMKDEQEEPRTSQEDENHVNEFINSYGCVSSGYYQDPTQSSHGERYSLPSTSTEQIKTEPYVEDYGVSEPTRESQPFSAVDTECSAAQSENRGHIDWMETGGPLSGLTLKPLKSKRTNTVEGQSSHISVKDRKLNHLKSHSRPSVSWDAAPSCKVCGKQFDSMVSLLNHVQTHAQDKEHLCGVCGKFCQSTERMIDHLQTHIGAKCCHVCGKYFAWDTFLKRHLRSHTGEKPFRCHDCGKGFTQRGHLNLHMRSHTGEKPHQCQDCGKGFSQSGNLAVHMKSHSGEKPHHCPVCGKCFIRNPDLTVHMRTHTGVKPYKCQYCGQGFKQNYNLKLHMKIHMEKNISLPSL